ncbi:MAG: HPr family phosphocarrier protein [Desulfuromonadales bacterium]|nr:HPr family phosphocarrier protein [Desulfuromonadales bacterium]
MIEQELLIVNRLGLHARASALFVKTANQFVSEVKLVRDGIEVNGKSIMGVMMLAASQGTRVNLILDGVDEQEAMKALSELINNGFGEE